jgi:hypothetical protein
MIVMLDTSEDLGTCARELGCPVEQLLTPLTRFTRRDPNAMFAIDNGAYARFDRDAFLALLLRERDARSQARFVVVPDVPFSARRTLEVFQGWRDDLFPWPLALAAQDGLEDMEIPWGSIAAIFIGGSTKWKESESALAVVRAAKALGKWVHMGRVNTPGRFELAERWQVDSIDGTGLSHYTHMRERIAKSLTCPPLFSEWNEMPEVPR